jgi:lysophospholipid acyltransferase 1/2
MGGELVHKPEDHVRLFFCLIGQIFIGQFMNLFVTQNGTIRHLFQAVLGFTIQIFMFRGTVYHIYIIATVAYLMMLLLPRNIQHKFVMVFVMGYLSSQHIYSMMNDFGGFNMDITTYTMLLVVKLWGLGWAYRDGGMDDKELTNE